MARHKRARRNTGNDWLILLKPAAVARWVQQNLGISSCHDAFQQGLDLYLPDCTHGESAPLVSLAMVVSGRSGQEAGQKALSRFNSAASRVARRYRPLGPEAVDVIAPGPVYLAEVLDLEVDDIDLVPFTRDLLSLPQWRRSLPLNDPDYEVRVASFRRTPESLARGFLPGTDENERLRNYSVEGLSAEVAAEREDREREEVADKMGWDIGGEEDRAYGRFRDKRKAEKGHDLTRSLLGHGEARKSRKPRLLTNRRRRARRNPVSPEGLSPKQWLRRQFEHEKSLADGRRSLPAEFEVRGFPFKAYKGATSGVAVLYETPLGDVYVGVPDYETAKLGKDYIVAWMDEEGSKVVLRGVEGFDSKLEAFAAVHTGTWRGWTVRRDGSFRRR